ncbi:MAG: hypothetical protein FJY74_03595 [Candidatus Eisenbacteria bacterium]|nr:hypothetical protein [Candidatus Eisenbacteria bacterium]
MTMRAFGTAALVAAIAIAALAAAPARADEVTDAIAAAQAAYGAGNLVGAGAGLETALLLLRAQLAARLAEFLPAAPSGWTAGPLKEAGTDPKGAGSAGGLVVSRSYGTPAGTTIGVSIAVDSPLLGSLRMMARNPALASMAGHPGMRTTTACGFDAVETSDERGLREVSVLIGARAMASVSGRDGRDAAGVKTLADALDCPGIAAVLE